MPRGMARPLPTRKSSVDLAAPVVRVSRIRRDPPPVAKPLSAAEVRDIDSRNVTIGIVAFALAAVVVLLAFTNVAGWSPSQIRIEIRQAE